MSEREAFLAAIRANPEDDLCRLVYADWLDDNPASCSHGERCGNPHHHRAERAAMIRRQCEQRDTGAEYRWVDSLDDHVIFGEGEFPTDVFLATDDDRYIRRFWLSGTRSLSVARGFITAVTLPFAEWAMSADRILADSVGLTVRLTDRPNYEQKTIRNGAIRFADDPTWYKPAFDWYASDEEDLISALSQRWPDVARWELPAVTVDNYRDAYAARTPVPGTMTAVADGVGRILGGQRPRRRRPTS